MRRAAWGTVLVLALAGGVLVPLPYSSCSPARAGEQEDKPEVDTTKVYYGDPAAFKSPAEVDADKVYRTIPEYRKILEDKLTEKDARYTVLLMKATKRFRCAVEGAAKDGAYDLVGNTGAIKMKGKTIPDITDAVLKKVQEAAR